MSPSFARYNYKVKIFVSYARKDRALCKTFIESIKDPALEEVAAFWMDEQLEPGRFWDEDIKDHLETAQIILLLLTPGFVESDYCSNIEGKRALELNASGQSTVIAVLLSECDYAAGGFDRVQLFPPSSTPLRNISNASRRLAEISLSLKYVVYEKFEQQLREVRPPEDYFESPECDLIMHHELDGTGFSTRHGSIIWAAIGATSIGSVGYGLLKFVHGGQLRGFWALLLFVFEICTLSTLAAASLRSLEIQWRQHEPSNQFLKGLWILTLALPAGLLSGVQFGLPLAIISWLVFGSLGWPGALLLGTFFGGLTFINLYSNTRSKRLRIYQDLVRNGRAPDGGWLIDSVVKEFEMARELNFRSRITKMTSPGALDTPQESDERQYSTSERFPAEGPSATLDSSLHTDLSQAATAPVIPVSADNHVDGEKTGIDDKPPESVDVMEARPPAFSQLSLLVIYHPENEDSWSDLSQIMDEEGLTDICSISAYYLDSSRDSFPDLIDHIERYDIILPMLSIPLMESSFDETTLLHSCSTCARNVKIVPVLLEQCKFQESALSQYQFLPEYSHAVSDWPIKKQAYRNIVRKLNKILLPDFRRRSYERYGTSSPRLTHNRYDFRWDRVQPWMIPNLIVGIVSGAFVWVIGHQWESSVTMAMTLSGLPLLANLLLLYVYGQADHPAQKYLSGKDKARILGNILPLLLVPALLAPLIFISMIRLWASLLHQILPATLFGFLDVGFVGGLVMGVLAYLSTRRRRPTVLQQLEPPDMQEPLIERRDGAIVLDSPIEDARHKDEGNLGEVHNRAPQVAVGLSHVFTLTYANVARLLIEVLFFAFIGWNVFKLYFEDPIFPLLRFTGALSTMLAIEYFLISTYTSIQFWYHDLWILGWRVFGIRYLWSRFFPRGRALVPNVFVLIALVSIAVLETALYLLVSCKIDGLALTILLIAMIVAGIRRIHLIGRFRLNEAVEPRN